MELQEIIRDEYERENTSQRKISGEQWILIKQ